MQIKKILSIALLFSYITPSYAVINDEFVEKTLSKDLTIKPYKAELIVDTFAETNSQKNQPLKVSQPLIDEFAELNKAVSVPKAKVTISEVLPEVNSSIPRVSRKYIAEDTKNVEIPVYIKSTKLISTRSRVEEGDLVNFETTKEVTIKNKIYPQGTAVEGRVETISMNYSFGVPADIIIGNFIIDKQPLQGEIKKIGANRSLWVKPCSYVTTLFFGLGLLIMPIRGGHAKIRPSETYKVYYLN
jgi:ribosomal protein L14